MNIVTMPDRSPPFPDACSGAVVPTFAGGTPALPVSTMTFPAYKFMPAVPGNQAQVRVEKAAIAGASGW